MRRLEIRASLSFLARPLIIDFELQIRNKFIKIKNVGLKNYFYAPQEGQICPATVSTVLQQPQIF